MKYLAIALGLWCGEANAATKLFYNMASSQNMAFPVITAGVDTQLLNDSALQANYNGTPVGTMVVQVSNDNVPVGQTTPSSNVVNWVDYPSTSTSPSIVGSTTGSTIFNLANMGFRWVRLKYTPAGSIPQSCNSCRLTVNFFGKGQ